MVSKPEPDNTGNVEIDRTLWLTAEQDALVEDGDPQAAFLWATAGKRMPKAEAEEFGYKPLKAKAEPKPTSKARTKDEDK
jgi:hypothetical protein